MKKLVVLLALVVFAVGLVVVSQDTAFSAWGKSKDEEVKAVETKAAVTKTTQDPELKLICKFKNAEEMAQFEQFYVAKQATFGRMGVLQAYFSMEQNNLTEIDRQMEEKFGFKMDPSKIYDLNRDAMEIKEAGPVPTAAEPVN
ncbi:MAG: hypothetical protein ABH815_01050 [Candidatus Omnitrophota bacterium]